MESNVSGQCPDPSQIHNIDDKVDDSNLYTKCPSLDSINNKGTLRKDSILVVNNIENKENEKSSEESVNKDENPLADQGHAKPPEEIINTVFKTFNRKYGKPFFLILSAIFILIVLSYMSILLWTPDGSNPARINSTTHKYVTTEFTEDPFTPVNSPNCNQDIEYYLQSWYHPPSKPIKYFCEEYQQIVIIQIEPLYKQKKGCFDPLGCYELIEDYKSTAKEFSKYSFYLDKYGIVYGGRDWMCQHNGGELWVAAMVDYTDVVKGDIDWKLVLHHLNLDIAKFATNCQYYAKDVITQQSNETSIGKPLSPVSSFSNYNM